MNKHLWRILGGLMRVALIYLPIKVTLFIISHFDKFWDEKLWQKFGYTDVMFLGFFLSLSLFYLLGLLTETRLIKWLDRVLGKLLSKLPLVGPLLTSLFNPQAMEIFKKNGFLIGSFLGGYQIAIFTAVHKTKEGYLGSVLYLTIPPTRQLLNEKSKIYVLEKEVDGVKRYEMIPAETAFQQEVSSGITVPADATKTR